MFCPNCGKLLGDNAKFCEGCGKEVSISKIAKKEQQVEEKTNQTFSQEEIHPIYKDDKKNRKKSSLPTVFGIIAFVVFFVWAYNGFRLNFSSSNEQESSGYSKAKLIEEMVKTVKREYNPPVKIDEVTTMVDVTAHPNSIRYHYILSDIDTNVLSNDIIKNSLIVGICENSDIQSVLNQDINMEYSYTVAGGSLSYFVTFTKSDCL